MKYNTVAEMINSLAENTMKSYDEVNYDEQLEIEKKFWASRVRYGLFIVDGKGMVGNYISTFKLVGYVLGAA